MTTDKLYRAARSAMRADDANPEAIAHGDDRRLELLVPQESLVEGAQRVGVLVVHAGRYPLALLGFPVFWAGDVLTLYAGLRAFGVHVGLAALVLAYTTAYVVTSLPLPAGGAGGVEAGLAFSLNAVGVPLAPALLVAVPAGYALARLRLSG